MNIMLDLETMGTGPTAAIVAIGAAQFDVAAGKLGDTFYSAVDLRSSVNEGGHIDPNTVLWWLGQSDEAREQITSKAEPLFSVLSDFAKWCKQSGEDVYMWGNGSDFDNVILASAFKRSGLKQPWEFYNNRCYRTLKNLFPVSKFERTGLHHHALDDAVSQANHVLRIFSRLQTF